MRPRLSGVDEAVVAVIATYCPSPDLPRRAGVVQEQVDTLVIADDGSPCTYDRVLNSTFQLPGVIGYRFGSNAGIARSLNAGLAEANRRGAPWLLTLDQDSDLSRSFVEDLLTDLHLATAAGMSVGVIAPQVVADKRGEITYPVRNATAWPSTEEVIQSGALWSVDVLARIDGFDERLAMDAVDAAACLAMRENGHGVALSPRAQMQHQWGDARYVRIFGRSVASTGHSAQRRANILRNRLRLFPREFRQSPTHALRTLRRVAVSRALATTRK